MSACVVAAPEEVAASAYLEPPSEHAMAPRLATSRRRRTAHPGDETRPFRTAPFSPDAVSMLFQPLFRVGRVGTSLHAVEALARIQRGYELDSPEPYLERARLLGIENSVDRICVRAALEAGAALRGIDLSVNVHASTLARDKTFARDLRGMLAEVSRPTSKLIVEIVEHSAPWNGERYRTNLDELRAMGVRIALDDVGLGYSDLRLVLESRPDYFKVDAFFVRNVAADRSRRAILEAVIQLAHGFGAEVVAEGVETDEELAAVVALGAEYAQGFLFQPPAPAQELLNVWPPPR